MVSSLNRGFVIFAVLCAASWTTAVFATSCREAAHALNQRLQPKIDEAELANMLDVLNESRNTQLPGKFVTKRQAQQSGWRPGRDLWNVPALRFKSIGGDHFGNREGRLPRGDWREADLNYRGGHRGAKRLLFSREGLRRVTVDHYQTFVEVPPCR
ncbi:barnase family single strand ribonuclease [Sulfuricella denitrificans skB26]|uniref:Ribonuclease n=1 Tax=Sulfuricella denitrificans (strain DSM 22764 / NBRC 105220 / skB26) TaxID=1163617 RepID=S6AM83_SULDS|nr:barnase family single strand ribonuclease [Sulfuricella denitrificans skB26]